MMAHSDVFVTVYSTMVVETAVHDTPIVAAVLDTPGGWNVPGKFSLSLKKIGNWPTHKRFRDARAGRVAAALAVATPLAVPPQRPWRPPGLKSFRAGA